MGCYKAPKCVVRKTTTFLSVQIDFCFFKHETLNAITQQKPLNDVGSMQGSRRDHYTTLAEVLSVTTCREFPGEHPFIRK